MNLNIRAGLEKKATGRFVVSFRSSDRQKIENKSNKNDGHRMFPVRSVLVASLRHLHSTEDGRPEHHGSNGVQVHPDHGAGCAMAWRF